MERDVPVFEAAKVLSTIRNSAPKTVSDPQRGLYSSFTHMFQKTRMCTPRQRRPSHQAFLGTYIECRGCHAAKCFLHILEGHIHASEAILFVASDREGVAWHNFHQTAKNREIRVVPEQFPICHPPSLRTRLVYYASNFARLLPVKSWMKSGFYDVQKASGFVLSGSHVIYMHSRNGSLHILNLPEKLSQDPQLSHRLQVHSQELALLRL